MGSIDKGFPGRFGFGDGICKDEWCAAAAFEGEGGFAADAHPSHLGECGGGCGSDGDADWAGIGGAAHHKQADELEAVAIGIAGAGGKKLADEFDFLIFEIAAHVVIGGGIEEVHGLRDDLAGFVFLEVEGGVHHGAFGDGSVGIWQRGLEGGGVAGEFGDVLNEAAIHDCGDAEFALGEFCGGEDGEGEDEE